MTCEMGRERIPFGKYRGKTFDELPIGYVKWLLTVDFVEPWVKRAAWAELARRGERFVSAVAVLDEIEEALTKAVAEDAGLSHDAAGRLTDHVLVVFEAVRERHAIGTETDMDISPLRLCPCAT